MYNTKNYFLIDKKVIENNNELMFNLYGRNKVDEVLRLIYEKGKSSFDTIVNCKYIYVHEENRVLYKIHYNNFTNNKLVPIDMKSFYDTICLDIKKLFKNPESIKNVEEAKKIVKELVGIIDQSDFTSTSLVAILSFDFYIYTHSLNVCIYAICVGKQMLWSNSSLKELGLAALLHDIGETQINPSVINKDGFLTSSEFQEVQNHPVHGWLIAKKVGITNKNILSGIRNHHEKMDGTGYPDKLKNNEIHIYAKIISVCDIFDALTTKKTYKDSKSTFDTLHLMKKEMFNQIDSKIINHFIRIFK